MAGPTHKPVGAGLPAMTSTRATFKVLTQRYRWQASSHRVVC